MIYNVLLISAKSVNFCKVIQLHTHIYMCVCVLSYSAVSDCLAPHGLYPARLLCPWDFPGNITGVGCHFLLQGIFPTEGLNPGLLHCRWILYRLNHQGSPKTEVIKGACSRGQSDMEASTLGLTSGVWFFINRQVRDCYVFTKPIFLFLLSIELDYNS